MDSERQLLRGGPGFPAFFFSQVGKKMVMQCLDSNQGRHASPGDRFGSVSFPHHGSLFWPHATLGLTPGSTNYYENLGKLLDLMEPR